MVRVSSNSKLDSKLDTMKFESLSNLNAFYTFIKKFLRFIFFYNLNCFVYTFHSICLCINGVSAFNIRSNIGAYRFWLLDFFMSSVNVRRLL